MFISKSPILVNVPEPGKPKLDFVYNFFVPNEKTDETGKTYPPGWQGQDVIANTKDDVSSTGIREKLLAYHSGEYAQAYGISREIPRYVKIVFPQIPFVGNYNLYNGALVDLTDLSSLGDGNDNCLQDITVGFLKANYDKCQQESEITTLNYGTVKMQDDGLPKRIKNLLDLTIGLRVPPEMAGASASDYATFIDNHTGADVSGKKLLESINALINEDPKQKSQLNFVNESKQPLDPSFLSSQTSEKLGLVWEQRFIKNLMYSSVNSTFCPYQNAMMEGLPHQKTEHGKTIETPADEAMDTDLDFEPVKVFIGHGGQSSVKYNIYPIDGSPADPSTDFPLGAHLLGYIITKYEIHPSGNKTKVQQPIIVDLTEEVNAHSAFTAPEIVAFDRNIKYGTMYGYSIQAAYMILSIETIKDANIPSGEYVCQWLVKSRSSAEVRVSCDEYLAPEPPADLNFAYDYSEDFLMLFWHMPITRQNDTKRIQIFRRKNTSLPFTIIHEYDFDDSIIRTPAHEIVLEKNKTYLDRPRAYHYDTEFGRDSDFIYAVASVDAHGYTSPYGGQFRVRFNKNTNSIDVYNVSQPGAPKQYPNFYLQSNYTEAAALSSTAQIPYSEVPMPDASIGDSVRVTEETMRDSGHRKMRVYFDPEYLRILPSETNEGEPQRNVKPLMSPETSGKYVINIINLDRIKSKSIEFVIKDNINGLRPPTSKAQGVPLTPAVTEGKLNETAKPTMPFITAVKNKYGTP